METFNADAVIKETVQKWTPDVRRAEKAVRDHSTAHSKRETPMYLGRPGRTGKSRVSIVNVGAISSVCATRVDGSGWQRTPASLPGTFSFTDDGTQQKKGGVGVGVG